MNKHMNAQMDKKQGVLRANGRGKVCMPSVLSRLLKQIEWVGKNVYDSSTKGRRMKQGPKTHPGPET